MTNKRKEYIDKNPYFKEWLKQYVGKQYTDEQMTDKGWIDSMGYPRIEHGTIEQYYLKVFEDSKEWEIAHKYAMQDATSMSDYNWSIDSRFHPWVYEVFRQKYPQYILKKDTFGQYADEETQSYLTASVNKETLYQQKGVS